MAGQLVPDERPDLFNQALMELGALVCTPRNPACNACPIAPHCEGHHTGRPDAYPAPKKRAAPLRVQAFAAVVEQGRRPQRLLVVRRPSKGLLGGLWEVPSFELDGPQHLAPTLRETLGIRVEPSGELGRVRHVFTHRHLTLVLIRCTPLTPRSRGTQSNASGDAGGTTARWCGPAELEELPLSRLMQKVLAEIAASRERLL